MVTADIGILREGGGQAEKKMSISKKNFCFIVGMKMMEEERAFLMTVVSNITPVAKNQ